jgi:hypothetical protein
MSLPDVSSYTRASVGPLTYLAAVQAMTQSNVAWNQIHDRYQDNTTAGACAQEVSVNPAQLLCEAWEYMERMPEPTDMVQQSERESLLRRIRAWGGA